MNPISELLRRQTRRHFIGRSTLGVAALASLFQQEGLAGPGGSLAHFAPKAKRVIYLFQSGGPSHLEMWDHKPKLAKLTGTELPDSIRMGQRLTGMTSGQKSFPVIGSKFKFTQQGKNGTWISELLPHTGKIIDDLCVMKTVNTEAINHDPAITLMQTGSQQPGRPSFGSWLSYGLGSESRDLPAFVVMISHGTGSDANQGLLDRLWGSGFLPTSHQGVKLRGGRDPVLYLSDPPGIDRDLRKKMLDGIGRLNQLQFEKDGDPEIQTRITQYEMAFKMQASVPELTDVSKESAKVMDSYGPDVKKPGSFAANCLLARRLVERGVRAVQIYSGAGQPWDTHGNNDGQHRQLAMGTDQAIGGLLRDLKQRGLLDETIVLWGGEFGRTPASQGGDGRDHNHWGFSVWVAGGGFRGGMAHGATDEFGYKAVEKRTHVHDLHATILHLMGIDHEKLTYRYSGRDHRLTDVNGTVIRDIIA